MPVKRKKTADCIWGAVEIIQHPNSHARYVNLQEWNLKTFHFAHQKARVDRNATLQWTIAAMGSGLAKVNQTVELAGRGAIAKSTV